jgi:hypothetical protein
MNSNPTSSSSLSTSQMPAEAVSRRAYELWEQDGRPEGRDLQHWLQAEQEVRGGDSHSNGHGTSATSSNSGNASARYDELGTARATTDTRPLSTGRTTPGASKRTSPPSTDRAGGNSSSATGNPMSGRRK